MSNTNKILMVRAPSPACSLLRKSASVEQGTFRNHSLGAPIEAKECESKGKENESALKLDCTCFRDVQRGSVFIFIYFFVRRGRLFDRIPPYTENVTRYIYIYKSFENRLWKVMI